MTVLARVLLAVAVTAVLTTFGSLCAFASPSIDDYWIAARVRDEGLLGSQLRWYTEWHGKFAGMLSMSGFAWVFDIVRQYWLAPAFLLAGMWTSSLFLVRSLCPDHSRLRATGAASVLAALWIAHVPEPRESVYWLTGAYAYQMGIICAVLLVGFIVRRGRSPLWTVVAVGLALAATGSSETLMLPLATLAFLWLCGAAKHELHWSRFGLSIAAAIALGSAVMILAPGNAIRGANFVGANHEVVPSLMKCLERGGRFFITWTLSPALLGASLLFAAPLCALAGRYRRPVGVRHVLGVYTLVAATFFPAYWATGSGPPPRAMAVPWVVFVVGWFFVVVPVLARACAARQWTLSIERRCALGAVALAIGLFVRGNMLVAVDDLMSGSAAAYRRQCADRDAALSAAASAGVKSVRVESLSARPRTLFVDDFGADPSDWRNGGAVRYYGLGELRAEPR